MSEFDILCCRFCFQHRSRKRRKVSFLDQQSFFYMSSNDFLVTTFAFRDYRSNSFKNVFVLINQLAFTVRFHCNKLSFIKNTYFITISHNLYILLSSPTPRNGGWAKNLERNISQDNNYITTIVLYGIVKVNLRYGMVLRDPPYVSPTHIWPVFFKYSSLLNKILKILLL